MDHTMLIDVHSHLDLCKNIDEIIKISEIKNIEIITHGINPESNRNILDLKEKYPRIKIALGVYPIEGLKLSDEEIDLEINFIKRNKDEICAIGEIGLDLKHADESSFEKQKIIFEKFVLLAKSLNVPAVVHSRNAEKQAIELLELINYGKIIMHCFGGDFALVQRIVKNKWYLSIPANVKYSNHFQRIVEIVPLENLFCETDSPYLHPDKKFPNTPNNVIESYSKIAEIKKITLKEVETAIEKNYNKIFRR